VCVRAGQDDNKCGQRLPETERGCGQQFHCARPSQATKMTERRASDALATTKREITQRVEQKSRKRCRRKARWWCQCRREVVTANAAGELEQ